MKSLVSYIAEQQIDEAAPVFYYSHKKGDKQFNFDLMSHGHAAERDMERLISSEEVKSLFKDCWSRFKKGIESGKILINKKDSKEKGSSVAIHCSEKTRTGYLTIIAFPVKYHKNAGYYDIEVVTSWKGKSVDDWKDTNSEGRTMYHPERGQVQMWDNFGINYRGKEDEI